MQKLSLKRREHIALAPGAKIHTQKDKYSLKSESPCKFEICSMVHSGGTNPEVEFVRVTPAGSCISLPTATQPCRSLDNRQPGSCPGLQPIRGAKTVGIIGNTVQVNFSKLIPNLGTRPQKYSPALCRSKKSQEYQFEGAPGY